MPTPNTTASIGDIDAISLLQESGLTPQEIADAILKSKELSKTSTEINEALTKLDGVTKAQIDAAVISGGGTVTSSGSFTKTFVIGDWVGTTTKTLTIPQTTHLLGVGYKDVTIFDATDIATTVGYSVDDTTGNVTLTTTGTAFAGSAFIVGGASAGGGTSLTTDQTAAVNKIVGLQANANSINNTVSFYDENFKDDSITNFNGVNGKLLLDKIYVLSTDGDFVEFEAKWNNPTGGYLITTGLFGMVDNSTLNCIGLNNSSFLYVRGNSTTWMQYNITGIKHTVFNTFKLIVIGTNLALYLNGAYVSSTTLSSPISINGIGSCYGTSYVDANVKSLEISTTTNKLPETTYFLTNTSFTATNVTETLIPKEFDLVTFPTRLKIVYDGSNKFMIYKPSSNKCYIGYEFIRSQVAPNSDNWRISMISTFDEEFKLIDRLLNGGACETAIKISENGIPADDFIGGQAHGDEVLTSFSCFIDNVKNDLSAEFSVEAVSFEFIQKSNLYAPTGVSYAGQLVANDIMRWGIYNNKSSSLTHNLTFTKSTVIVDLYLFMLPVLRKYVDKQITDRFSVSNEYVEYDVSEEGHTNNQMFIGTNMGGNVKLWSEVSGVGVDINVISEWMNDSHFNVSPQPAYNKLYFDFIGANTTVDVGRNFKTKVEYDFLYNKIIN